MQKKERAKLVRQICAFLDPDTWAPPANTIITPMERNRLRMIHEYVGRLQPVQTTRAILHLRATYLADQELNLVAKRPLTIARQSYLTSRVLYHITTLDLGYDGDVHAWQDLASSEGWTCESCQLANARPPRLAAGHLQCARWVPGEREVHVMETPDSCLAYTGPQDPVVLLFTGYALAQLVDALAPGLPRVGPWPYVTDLEQYADLHERAAARG